MQKDYLIKNKSNLIKIVNQIMMHVKIPVIFLLYGQLGTGKTTFTKYLAQSLKIKTKITSPTFMLCKDYRINQKSNLVHYDFYRLRHINDLYEIGFWESINNGIVVVEWPDKIKNLISKISQKFKGKIIKIYFFHTKDENSRKIILKT